VGASCTLSGASTATGEVVLAGMMSLGLATDGVAMLMLARSTCSFGGSGDGLTSEAVAFSGRGATMVFTGAFCGDHMTSEGTGTSLARVSSE